MKTDAAFYRRGFEGHVIAPFPAKEEGPVTSLLACFLFGGCPLIAAGIVKLLCWMTDIPFEGRSISPARKSSLDVLPRSPEGFCPREPCPLGRPTPTPGISAIQRYIAINQRLPFFVEGYPPLLVFTGGASKDT